MKIIYESLVLVDYVEDRSDGPSLLPLSPTERARARIIIGRYDSKFVPLFYKLLRETDREAAHALAGEMRSEMEWLEGHLSPEGEHTGSRFSSVKRP